MSSIISPMIAWNKAYWENEKVVYQRFYEIGSDSWHWRLETASNRSVKGCSRFSAKFVPVRIKAGVYASPSGVFVEPLENWHSNGAPLGVHGLGQCLIMDSGEIAKAESAA